MDYKTDNSKGQDSLEVQVFKSKKHKIKQPEACEKGILPKMHCSYLVVGKSGSGKSNVVLHMLNSRALLGGAFDMVLYLCDSPDDLFKENLKIPKENFIKNFTEEWLEKLIDKQRVSVEKKGADKTNNVLLIFDDILSKQKFLNSKILTKLVTECRHYNISCIFNTQSYKKIPRVVRLNVRGIILFPSSLGELIKFSEENCLPNMSNKRFLELVQHCTKEQYQFAFMQQDAPAQDRLRKNFNKIVN
jgi:ABC-type proline/glycine betaine transport system ATPase subunit